MYKRSVNDPDGVVERSVGGLTRRRILIGGGPQRLQPVEQENEHAHHGDGGSDAGPHGQVEGREEREDVDLLLRLPQQDADAVIQVALAEVHHVLPLGRDGDGRHGQVGSLGGGSGSRQRNLDRTNISATLTSEPPRHLVDEVADHPVPRAVGKLRSIFVVGHLQENIHQLQ